jgi:hypothetical protein
MVLNAHGWPRKTCLVVRYVSFMASVCHFIKKESEYDQTWLGSGISPHLDLEFLDVFRHVEFKRFQKVPHRSQGRPNAKSSKSPARGPLGPLGIKGGRRKDGAEAVCDGKFSTCQRPT